MSAPLRMGTMSAAALLLGGAVSLLQPRQQEEVYEYAERELKLSSNVTAEPGPLRLRTYQKGKWSPLWAWRRFAEIATIAATQTGKTLEEQVTMAYAVAIDPGPGMMVFPTELLSKRRSKKHLRPFIEANLGRFVGDSKHDLSMLEYVFAHGMTINLAHSGSPAQLAGEPIRYLWMDENAKFAKATDEEPGAELNAEERTKAFRPFHKHWKSTTPTLATEPGWSYWEDSTQCEFEVPCKDCGTFQVAYFGEVDHAVLNPEATGRFTGGVKWDRDESLSKAERLASAYYQCAHCESRWNDYELNRAMDAGRWRPRRPEAAHYCAHKNSLVAPSITMGMMLRKWFDSYKNPERRQVFFNSWLAIPYREEGAKASEKVLRARIQVGRARGVVPAEAAAVLLTADVHDAHLRYRVRAWATDGTSWGIEEGSLLPELANLEPIMEREYLGIDGRPRFVDRSGIDCNWRTSEVLHFCRRHSGRVHPMSGSPRQLKSPYQFRKALCEPDPSHDPPLLQEGEVFVIDLDDHRWKVNLFNKVAVEPGTPGAWYLEDGVSDNFIWEMQGEEKVTRVVGGRLQERFALLHDNHALDCEKYQLVLFHVLGVPSMTMERDAQAPTTSGQRIFNPYTGEMIDIAGGAGE